MTDCGDDEVINLLLTAVVVAVCILHSVFCIPGTSTTSISAFELLAEMTWLFPPMTKYNGDLEDVGRLVVM